MENVRNRQRGKDDRESVLGVTKGVGIQEEYVSGSDPKPLSRSPFV